jgi:hypothetical protein
MILGLSESVNRYYVRVRLVGGRFLIVKVRAVEPLSAEKNDYAEERG